MKVLFLTKYPEEGASSRYRVYQYLPYLCENGVTCDVQSFMSPRMYKIVFRPGHTISKALYTFLAVLRRLAVLFSARKYNLIYMQRECLPFGPPFMEKLFMRCDNPTIFDYDDALYIFKSSTHNRLVDYIKRPQRIFEIFSLVDCVLTGNNYLKKRALEYCRSARTFLVAEDTDRYAQRPLHKNGDTFTIGWLGSPSTEKYLNLVTPALQKICAKYTHVQVKIVGGGDFHPEGVPVIHVPWSMEDEVAHLHSFDVGIMSLPFEEWSKGKSGGKARTYMAVGLPAVCTAIGFNLELIEDKRTGFLVRDEDEWVTVLSSLVESAELRQKVGDAGREYVVQNLSLQVLAPEFHSILKDVAGAG